MPAIRETDAAISPSAAAAAVSTPTAGSTANISPHYWTWRLLADGYSLAECLQIRGIKRDTALRHLLSAVAEGKEVPLERVLTDQELNILRQSTRGRETSARRLFEELHGAVGAEAIELFLASQ